MFHAPVVQNEEIVFSFKSPDRPLTKAGRGLGDKSAMNDQSRIISPEITLMAVDRK
jgi:hypothetical protein